MITFLDFESDKVVAIKISGKIGEEELEAVTALLEKRMEKHPKVRLYVEVDSFQGFSPEAFFKDLKFGIRHWDRFDREAVVTKQEWMLKISELADNFLDGIEVRTFRDDEKERAREWISQ